MSSQSNREGKVLTLSEALREALYEEMARDKTVFVMGEDVGEFGGPFQVAKGLISGFGKERVRETPISEAGFIGAAVGAAMTGMRPVVEVMFSDFLTCAMDQIVNHAAKMHLMSVGNSKSLW
jgi:pyruvate dehydrogenase E1 component beta subunit